MEIADRHDSVVIRVDEVGEAAGEDYPFSSATYREAIRILEIKIRELENQRKKPLKSRIAAYISTGLFAPTSVGVLAYQAFLDAGVASDDRTFHLASIVTMVGMMVFSGVALASWQCLAHQTGQQEQVDKELQGQKKYKQFKVAAISFFQNPSVSLYTLLRQTYAALPEEVRALHQKEMARADRFFVPDAS